MNERKVPSEEERADTRRTRRFSFEILSTVLSLAVSVLSGLQSFSDLPVALPVLAAAVGLVAALQAVFVARVRGRSSPLTQLKSQIQAAYVGSLRLLELPLDKETADHA